MMDNSKYTKTLAARVPMDLCEQVDIIKERDLRTIASIIVLALKDFVEKDAVKHGKAAA